jgi:anthranilate synthase component II
MNAVKNTLLIIDNYDSFTFNLLDQISCVSGLNRYTIVVKRNDKISLEEIYELNCSAVFISPGPGTPQQSKISFDFLKSDYAKKVPVFGVCLGLQTIVVACGGSVVRAQEPLHGLNSTIKITNKKNLIFKAIPTLFNAGRYHSLIAAPPLPQDLTVLAESELGEIMAISHNKFPWWGVQFHPESFLSEHGDILIRNFLDYVE